MKLRQAKKIMKNVRLYPGMHYLYGSGRIMKACGICTGHYARTDKGVKLIRILCDKDPLLALKVLIKNRPYE